MKSLGGRGKSKGRLIPYFIDFLVSCTKTGEYEKSEDGGFPPTEVSPYILLTLRSCDLYRMTNYDKIYYETVNVSFNG